MSWLDSTLGNRVRHEEEIESAVHDFCLFDESMVNIGTLGRVENLSLVASSGLLKESLSNAVLTMVSVISGRAFPSVLGSYSSVRIFLS